jgi:hypothetical protein
VERTHSAREATKHIHTVVKVEVVLMLTMHKDTLLPLMVLVALVEHLVKMVIKVWLLLDTGLHNGKLRSGKKWSGYRHCCSRPRMGCFTEKSFRLD